MKTGGGTREAQAGAGLRVRLFPSTQAVFYQMAQERFAEEPDEELRALAALKTEVVSRPAKEAGLILVSHSPAIYHGIDPLSTLHATVIARAEDVDAEQRRLGLKPAKVAPGEEPGSFAVANPVPTS